MKYKEIAYQDESTVILLDDYRTSVNDMRYCGLAGVDLTKHERYRVYDKKLNIEVVISISPYPETVKYIPSSTRLIFERGIFDFIYDAEGKIIFLSNAGDIDGLIIAKVTIETVAHTSDKKAKDIVIGRRTNLES